MSVISGPASGQSVDIDRQIVLGREGADLTIDDPEMSRRHAALRPVGHGVEIEDLGSLNGTFVDGRRIDGPEQLTGKTTVRVGNSKIRVEVAPPARARPEVTRAHEEPVVDAPQATRTSPVAAQPQTTRVSAAAGADVTAPRRVDAPQKEVPSPTVTRPVPPSPVADDEGWESERNLAKVALITMVLVAITGLIGVLHPQPEPGDDNPRAFLDTIVPSDTWTLLHLIILLSYVFSVPYFFVLWRSLNKGRGAAWARVGYAAAVISIAAAVVWMMLDGFAMKEIADDWDAAAGAEKVAVEQAAFAIEHVILALFSLNLILFSGVAIILYGLGLLRDGRWPAAIAPAGIAVGVASTVIGVIQAFTERTALVTHLLVPIIYVLLTIWLVATTITWWRRVQAT